MSIVIIGSGPTAAAAAHALCKLGLHVTVLDAGDRIEPRRTDAFAELARSPPEDWPPGLAARARGAFAADVGHIPLKPAYGSLSHYALNDLDLPLVNEGADVVSSLAYGGLSNAWGASMLPFRQRDIEHWPFSLQELAPHYRHVQRFVPVAAELDELAELMPLYADAPAPLPRERQSQEMLEHMRRHTQALASAGFSFGASRLAVVAADTSERRCRHCGMCLYGCPYRSIYNSAHTLDALRRSGDVDYRGGIFVERLSEAGDVVAIDFHRRREPARKDRMTASRVLVACGAVASTRLMLESMGLTRHSLRMLDSQYFVIPMVTARAAPVSVASQGNTLAQVFVELEAGRISRHMMHLQLYGYNDIMLAAFARRIPLRMDMLERALHPLLGRLLVIQGFMHSADSPGLTLNYHAGKLRIVGDDTATSSRRIGRLVRLLAASARSLGMAPVPRLAHVGRPGKSNHVGGSLPMRRRPHGLETDLLGRIPPWTRVHVVDASTFPSIPATTVTLSAMANAHRIATAVAQTLSC